MMYLFIYFCSYKNNLFYYISNTIDCINFWENTAFQNVYKQGKYWAGDTVITAAVI